MPSPDKNSESENDIAQRQQPEVANPPVDNGRAVDPENPKMQDDNNRLGPGKSTRRKIPAQNQKEETSSGASDAEGEHAHNPHAG